MSNALLATSGISEDLVGAVPVVSADWHISEVVPGKVSGVSVEDVGGICGIPAQWN